MCSHFSNTSSGDTGFLDDCYFLRTFKTLWHCLWLHANKSAALTLSLALNVSPSLAVCDIFKILSFSNVTVSCWRIISLLDFAVLPSYVLPFFFCSLVYQIWIIFDINSSHSFPTMLYATSLHLPFQLAVCFKANAAPWMIETIHVFLKCFSFLCWLNVF